MTAAKQKAIATGRRAELTAAQSRIVFDEVERLHRNFVEIWRRCPNRRCRRQRQCLGGAEPICTGGRTMPDRTKRQDWRLVKDFLRAPPPGYETAVD